MLRAFFFEFWDVFAWRENLKILKNIFRMTHRHTSGCLIHGENLLTLSLFPHSLDSYSMSSRERARVGATTFSSFASSVFKFSNIIF
jgi:hypothetical protein